MGNLLQDLRYGFRTLVKNPGFTLVAVLTLGLGIGANTAIFSVVNAVLLRPLPFPQPDHLVKIWGNFSGIGIPNNQNWISAPEFKDLESLNKTFAQISAIDSASVNLTIIGSPQRLLGYLVSPSFFPMLGAQPFNGGKQYGRLDSGSSLRHPKFGEEPGFYDCCRVDSRIGDWREHGDLQRG